MSRLYQGRRDPTTRDTSVTVNGAPLPLRLEIRNASPTGFEWGYSGSGPTQLAIAVLADHVEHAPDDAALLLKILGLPEACDVCAGEGAVFDPVDPVEVGRRFFERRPGTLLAPSHEGDPCWNCTGDGERSLDSLINRVALLLRGSLIRMLPETAIEWTLGTPLVHALLVDAASRALQKATADEHGPGCTGKLRGGLVDCPGGGATCAGSGAERALRD